MPSRNKKNKNRTQSQQATTSAAKDGVATVKIGENVEIAKESAEQQSNIKFTITEAKEKLNQLQQTVDTIKGTIVQSKPDKSDEKLENQRPASVEGGTMESEFEQPFETQTMKKKRNRNRNRNRNKKNQNADESGVSSTSGTNENSTHENSPTPIALGAIVLPLTDVITKKIKDEPAQVEISGPLDEIKTNIIEIKSDLKPVEVKSDKIKAIVVETKTDVKTDIKIDDTPKSDGDKKIVMSKVTSKPTEIENVTAENEKIIITDIEKDTIESEKHQKDNEKQKKNRQGKNNNKNQKEKAVEIEAKVDTAPKIDIAPKVEKKDEKPIKVEQIETKVDLTESKNDELDAKNKHIKTVKDNKKSPKPNKKNQPDEIKKEEIIDVVEQKTEHAKLSEISVAANKEEKIVDVKNVSVKMVEDVKAVNKYEKLPKNETPLKIIEKPTKIEPIKEEITLQTLAAIQIENTAQNTPKPVKQEISTEIKTEMKQENKEEVKPDKKQSTEQKSIEPAVESPKENKKPKGNKKTPPQAKKQIELKPEKNEKKPAQVDECAKNIVQSEKLSENVAAASEKKDETQNAVLTINEIAPIEAESKPMPAKIEPPTEAIIAKTPKVEKPIQKIQEKIKTEINEPTLNIEAAAVESDKCVLKEENAPALEVTSKIEKESKKSEISVATPNEEGTQTPTTTPVLTTPAPEPAKKPAQEDETAKIWKILEEASKSLEPVEIQMDDPAPPIIDPIPIETAPPIICSEKNEQQAKVVAQELVTLLETKEPSKVKTGAQPKTAKAKESNQQAKQSSPSKSVEVQSKKLAEPKRKEAKPTQKNAKSNKPTEQPTSSMKGLEKMPDKTVEKAPDKAPDKTPSVEKNAEKAVAADNAEVLLDVSIMPDEIEVAELNADSKNVQGSGFAPSVEQSAVEVKSLVPEYTKIESNEAHDMSKSKCKSPVNLEKEESLVLNQSSVSQATKNAQGQDLKASAEDNSDEVIEATAQEPKEPKQSQAKCLKSSAKSLSPEKCKSTGQNTKQKEPSPNTVQGKPNQNGKKTNCKPAVPPKPEHLVSSHAKKPAAEAIKSKTEKILVLTGNMEDDDSEDDYIEYKFMPRQVFIATICQSCKKPTEASERVLCPLCQMVSYCCAEHVKTDEPIHKDLCAALQEIAKKRGGHIYNNARILNDNDYRSLRVHTLNLCENFLKRPLQTFEREILLFPRLCLTPTCREWRQNLLTDCPNCGQVFFCSNQPEHLMELHQRWCEPVALYQKLVVTQSVSGRIEPSLPSRIQNKPYTLPNAIGDVFKDLYKNISVIKDDCMFATLTQLATAPLTAFFAIQKSEQIIGEKFTIHLVGAELQFEADVLDIWETFFLHLAPNLMELTIVFCGPELNAENIPLDIISRIRMCRTCRQNCRIVKFDFQCAKFYHDYAMSSAYSKPDLICFFNPGFHHINGLNGLDTWSETIKIASSSGCPVIVTSYTEYESPRDLDRFQLESTNGGKQMTLIHGPEFNVYSSQRPERNFISDELVPLIFKNYFCFIMK